mmetsp:Transcript_23375/g.23566  ORF Transcript_23375/g.23566 Transcript_23375/m.23566 type:complete len:229 (+) Transcript_23375:138-824(+)
MLRFRRVLVIAPQFRNLYVSVRNASSCCNENACKCWKCGRPLGCCTLFCKQKDCGIIQRVETECNYFELLDMPTDIDIDLNQLESSFKDKQKKLHPDMYTTKSEQEQEASNTSSSTINQAYQVLKHPLERSRYLLSLHGIKLFEEGKTLQNSSFLMEIFMRREELEETLSLSLLASQRKRTKEEVKLVWGEMQEALREREREGEGAGASSGVLTQHRRSVLRKHLGVQ